jgi:hypothetical protein
MVSRGDGSTTPCLVRRQNELAAFGNKFPLCHGSGADVDEG